MLEKSIRAADNYAYYYNSHDEIYYMLLRRAEYYRRRIEVMNGNMNDLHLVEFELYRGFDDLPFLFKDVIFNK